MSEKFIKKVFRKLTLALTEGPSKEVEEIYPKFLDIKNNLKTIAELESLKRSIELFFTHKKLLGNQANYNMYIELIATVDLRIDRIKLEEQGK